MNVYHRLSFAAGFFAGVTFVLAVFVLTGGCQA